MNHKIYRTDCDMSKWITVALSLPLPFLFWINVLPLYSYCTRWLSVVFKLSLKIDWCGNLFVYKYISSVYRVFIALFIGQISQTDAFWEHICIFTLCNLLGKCAHAFALFWHFNSDSNGVKFNQHKLKATEQISLWYINILHFLFIKKKKDFHIGEWVRIMRIVGKCAKLSQCKNPFL